MEGFIFCSECGKQIAVGKKFCTECGAAVKTIDVPVMDEDATVAAVPMMSPAPAAPVAAPEVPVAAAPVAPEVPVAAAPVAPEVPVAPAAPVAPEVPVAAAPVAPEVPVAAAPVAPEAPVAAAPVAPEVPVAPAAPVAPAPAAPVAPTPTVPVAPMPGAPAPQGMTPAQQYENAMGQNPQPKMVNAQIMNNQVAAAPVIPREYKPVNMWGYYGLGLLLKIPFIGFICTFIFAFAPKNKNIKNYARSYFCSWIVGAIVSIIVTLLIIFVGGSMLAYIEKATGNSGVYSVLEEVIVAIQEMFGI